jgi:hypothetical protein
MTYLLNDFEWIRDRRGYCIKFFDGEHWICPNGGRDDWIKYQPFARRGDLCLPFAKVRTPHQLLTFINNYGALGWVAEHESVGQSLMRIGNLPVPVAEHVVSSLVAAEMFRELLNLRARGNPNKLTEFFKLKAAPFFGGGLAGKVDLASDSKRGVRLKLLPPSLVGAVWYQLALKLSGSTDLRMCRHCACPFEVGAGTGRRADAEFCCNKHKLEFFNRRRSKRSRVKPTGG